MRIWPKNIEGTADPANHEEQTYISGSNMGSTQNENEMHSLPASPEHGLQGGPRDQGAQGEGGEETSNGDVRCAEAEVNVSTNGSSKSHTQDTLPAVVNKELQVGPITLPTVRINLAQLTRTLHTRMHLHNRTQTRRPGYFMIGQAVSTCTCA